MNPEKRYSCAADASPSGGENKVERQMRCPHAGPGPSRAAVLTAHQLRTAAALLLAMLLLPKNEARALDLLRVRFLGTLQKPQPMPHSWSDYKLNNSGVVIGFRNEEAAVWENGVVRQLGKPSNSTFSRGYDINDTGRAACQVNLDLFMEEHSVAVFTPPSTWRRTLFPSGTRFTLPTAISSNGLCVGSASVAAGLPGKGFYLLTTADTPVLLPPKSGDIYSSALAVSNTGLIAGVTFLNVNSPSAMIWNTSGAAQVLAKLGTVSDASGATGINDNNISVGYSNVSGTEIAVWWDSDGLHGITNGTANAISNSNVMIGNTKQTYTASQSLGWIRFPFDTTVFSLSAFQSDPALTLYTASDINTNLQVTGISSQGGYIATPILIRTLAGPWNTASSWAFRMLPTPVHPVRFENASPVTITGPESSAAVAELAVSENVRFELRSGQTLSVAATHFGNGLTAASGTGTIVIDGQLNSGMTGGGRISGKGTVTGNISLTGGTFSPGSDYGVLTVNGSFRLAQSATFVSRIDGSPAAAQQGSLVVNGTVQLDGAGFGQTGAYAALQPGESFTVIDNDGTDPITGEFAGFPEGKRLDNFLSSGLTAVVSYVGGSGNDMVLTAVELSDNAALSSLTVSDGDLSPAFDPAITTYTLSVPHTVTQITVTVGTGHNGAVLHINGSPSPAVIALTESVTTVEIGIVAEDQTTMQRYIISVTREDSPYDAWKAEHFGAAADDPNIAGWMATPTHDGIPNLVKYALGLDPLTSAHASLPEGRLTNGVWTLGYPKVKAATDVVRRVQWSSDGITWQSSGVVETIVPERETAETQWVEATVSGPGPLDRVLLRLEISRVP